MNCVTSSIASVEYYSSFLCRYEADTCFHRLLETIVWQSRSIKMFGKSIPIPRLTAWYADPGAIYRYSGLTEVPAAWTPELDEMRRNVAAHCEVGFNSVLANLYRDGSDSMGWHSDDERELGPEPIIASISFGEERRFEFRSRDARRDKLSILLEHGSLLVMKGETQANWMHRLPKSRHVTEPRINLTFRAIVGTAFHSSR
jgi:alkylated DNA repair dioxygenase AlkB